MSKTVIFLLILQVLAIYGADQFMIKNKKSGMVLDAKNYLVSTETYEGKNSQLWTLRSGRGGANIIRNVGNGKALDACPKTKQILTWPEHGYNNQQWKVNDDGRINVLHFPDRVMVHRNNGLFLDQSRYNDESDEWLLVEP